MMRTKIVAWATFVLAFVIAMASLLVPTPAQDGAAFHSSLFLSALITVAQMGAALLFVWGLGGFKHKLRVAYGLICAGIVVLGFSNLQLAFVSYFDLSQTVYVKGGIITIPYIAPALLVFFGVRLFAQLFQLKSIWMSFWFVMGLAVAGAVGTAVLGGILRPADGQEFVASIALSAWTAVFLLATMFIAMSAKQVAGPLYQDALSWFVAARVLVTITGFSYVVLLMFFGDQTAFSKYGGVLVPSAIAAFLFLRSGYAFKLINEDHTSLAADKMVNMIEVVTFAASQASNPSQIDTILDKLRTVTAEVDASTGAQALTTQQQEELKRIYADIEHYLVEQEPLRRLTAEEVRRKCARYFHIDYDAFVTMVTSAPSAPAN